VRPRFRALAPLAALGVVGAAFDAVRRLDPVSVREIGGFYAGDLSVRLLGFPSGVHAASLWPGTVMGLRPVFVVELLVLYACLHAAAAVAAGRAFAHALPDADPPTTRTYARLFAVSVGAATLLGPVTWVVELEFLLAAAYLLVVGLGVLPVLVAVPPVLVAERATLREAYGRANDVVAGQYVRVLVALAVVGLLADALVSAPVAGGFLGTAGGAAAYAELGRRVYRAD
jgi:hypothetical protein